MRNDTLLYSIPTLKVIELNEYCHDSLYLYAYYVPHGL